MMSFTFIIGEAVERLSDPDDPQSEMEWVVEALVHPDAPNTTDCHQTNVRSPAYNVWHHFGETTGLADVFNEDRRGSPLHLIEHHPGIATLTQAHLDRFEAARADILRRQPGAVPRFSKQDPWNSASKFDDVGPLDAHLARLEWLVWWTRWALATCERPSFYNR